MANIVLASITLLMFLTFVFNSTNSSLNLMTSENQILQSRAKQYIEENQSMINAEGVEGLKIGVLK